MASASMIARCKDTVQNPKIQFLYDGSDYTSRVTYISPIIRNRDLNAVNVQVKLDNHDGTFDIFYSTHDKLTESAVIKWGFGGVGVSYTSNTITFHNNVPGPDTIEDSAGQFIIEGFRAGMVFTVTDSLLNDGSFTITSVTADVISVKLTDSLNGDLSETELTLASEDVTMFTGYVEKAEADHKLKTITLSCRDRISLLLDKQIQVVSSNKIYPVYWNQLFITGLSRGNASVLSDTVWDILIDYGELDDTASTANTDIDYTSFTAWATAVDDGGYDIYDIQVYAEGETVAYVLMRICQMTESFMWVGGDGKIKFYSSLQSLTGQEYTKSELLEASWKVALEGRINNFKIAWAYNSASDLWLSDDSGLWIDSLAVGPTGEAYIYQTEWVNDQCVSHNSADAGSITVSANSHSAEQYTTEKMKRTAAPPRTWNLQVGRLGLLEDIGNLITMTDVMTSPYDDIDVNLISIVYDLQSMQATLEGWHQWSEGELA